MICEKCQKRDATVHLTEIIKNIKTEIHLCEFCAKDFGLSSKLSNFSLSVPDILSFLNVDEIGDMEDASACRKCGMTFIEYRKRGKLGCPECYQHMDKAVESIIYNFHGERKHVGKVPMNYIESKTPVKRIANGGSICVQEAERMPDLKEKLERAVMEERYEEAARLRDIICRLESEKKE